MSVIVAGANLRGISITSNISPPPEIVTLFWDTFTGAAGDLTAHTPEVGAQWTAPFVFPTAVLDGSGAIMMNVTSDTVIQSTNVSSFPITNELTGNFFIEILIPNLLPADPGGIASGDTSAQKSSFYAFDDDETFTFEIELSYFVNPDSVDPDTNVLDARITTSGGSILVPLVVPPSLPVLLRAEFNTIAETMELFLNSVSIGSSSYIPGVPPTNITMNCFAQILFDVQLFGGDPLNPALSTLYIGEIKVETM